MICLAIHMTLVTRPRPELHAKLRSCPTLRAFHDRQVSGLEQEPDVDRRVSKFHVYKVSFRAESGRCGSATRMSADSQDRTYERQFRPRQPGISGVRKSPLNPFKSGLRILRISGQPQRGTRIGSFSYTPSTQPGAAPPAQLLSPRFDCASRIYN